MSDLATDANAAIRDVPDFPRPGILFKDITPLLLEPALYARVSDWMAAEARALGAERVVGVESRGFIFGASIAERLGVGLSLARKAGKLPHATRSVDYALEYGHATLQMHVDAIAPGQKVVIVDDLLATGGTAAATADLIRGLGGEVAGFVFLVELGFLDGRGRLGDLPVRALVKY